MDRGIHALFFTIAAASLLAGCASTRPAAPAVAARAPAPVAAAASTPESAKSDAALAAEAGYMPATRVGAEVYCKRELMTGSRTRSTETCLTAAQIEKQRNSSDAQLRDIQEMSNGRPTNSADGSGGRYNNVMTQ